MTPEQKSLARTLFKLKIHQAEGFQFENLFGQVMECARPGFTKIKPYGNQGDRGADAYEADIGRYYQVFAPENPTASKAAAIKKAQVDFASKLLPYWGAFCSPKEYHFVFNDKYSGSVIDLERTLAELKSTYSLADAKVFRSKDLEDEFIRLDEDLIIQVVGGIPNKQSTEFLDYSVLAEVIQYILDSPEPYAPKQNYASPDFEEKIAFNELSYYGGWLRVKQLEAWHVDEFLSRQSNFAKQDIRNRLAGYYEDSVVHIQSSDSNLQIGDLRFVYILDKIAPQSSDPRKDRLLKGAGLVIMSKYFESCDIFEEPKHVPTS